ncbi:hypothetical protein [Photobacterium kagoshimensis]|uniref:hypothetical protein n=1 Tax=Photobacterium kagoshimensis TaxID=2910242 RepID=UPI003D0B80E7
MNIYRVCVEDLPEHFPTHKHTAVFWEGLGRTVATFGFLEETLLKSIFALSSTTQYPESEIELAYTKWCEVLERSVSDQLGSLIDTYGKCLRNYQTQTIDLEYILIDLREAAKIRNVLCHGSWQAPDIAGGSVPFFVNRQKEIFDTAVDVEYLKQVQQHVKELSCSVINSVTQKGLQFPGSKGPGKPAWKIA